MLIRTFLFFFLSSFAGWATMAQNQFNAKDISHGDVSWIQVENIPETMLPKDVISYRFHVVDSSEMALYAETKKGKLFQVNSWKEQCFYNANEGDVLVFSNEKGIVKLCSGSDENANYLCCVFDFGQTTPRFVSLDFSDADADLVHEGDSCLLDGNIVAAVAAFEKISAPSYYMDMLGKGMEILETAYPLAAEAYDKGNAPKAAQLMQAAINYEGAWPFSLNHFKKTEELKSYAKEWPYETDFVEMFILYEGDYAFYLQQAKRWTEALKTTAYLIQLFPEEPDFCLIHADALFDMGKTGDATVFYKRYVQQMKSLEKENEIVSRAISRSE